MEQIAQAIIGKNEHAAHKLEKDGSADLSYGMTNARFRVNIFRQRGSCAIVMRVIPEKVPSFAELDLPPQLSEVCGLRNGIVLVTGPTGSGKSSTLAAVIDKMNAEKAIHVLTIKDPIEFLHRHKKATIHQRELHSDTPTFAAALRGALRQAPKVILVGEMRDSETIEIALEAAETGHLVLSTLHTIDAAKNGGAYRGGISDGGSARDTQPPVEGVSLHPLATAFTAQRRKGPHRGDRDSEIDDAHSQIRRKRRRRRKNAARCDARRQQ
jgi:twitching motility protein PilT